MPDELRSLAALMRARQPEVVGVDGMNGAGKSRRVARHLGMPVLSLDSYLKGNGHFVEGIQYDRLARDVGTLERPMVIEGCCLLAVMAKAQIKIDLHVYVRRVSPNGLWYESDVGEGESAERLLRHEDATSDAIGAERKGLGYELILYHRDFQPLHRADIVVDLVERPAD